MPGTRKHRKVGGPNGPATIQIRPDQHKRVKQIAKERGCAIHEVCAALMGYALASLDVQELGEGGDEA